MTDDFQNYLECERKYADSGAIIACMLEKTGKAISKNISKDFNTSTEGMLDSIFSSVSDINSSVAGMVVEVSSSLANSVDNIFSSVSETSRDVIDNSTSYVSSVYDNVTGFLRSGVEESTKFIDSLIKQVKVSISQGVGYIENVAIDVSEFVSKLYDDFEGSIASSISSISSLASGIISEVSDYVENDLSKLDLSISSIIDTIVGQGSEFIDYIVTVFDSVVESYQENIEPLITEAMAFFDVAAKNASIILETIAEDWIPDLGELQEGLKGLFSLFSAEKVEEFSQGFADFIDMWIRELKDPNITVESALRKMVESTGAISVVFKPLAIILLFMVNIFAILPSISAMGASKMTTIAYNVLSEYPITAFSIAEAITLASRDFIAENEAVENNRKHGYQDDKTSKLINASKQRLDPDRLMTLLRREKLTTDEFVKRLKRLGFTNKAIESFKSLKDLIPPPADLISMSVREAFSEDIIEAFKTAEDLPEIFVKWMGKQGYTKEWARRYWIAHWRLPSAGQGFQMYHRNVISDDQLDMLLKALDVSPFWREKLKRIAFRPVTRVDIRRMYSLKVIDIDNVDERYRALGYSPEDAETMTKFTIAYAEGGEADDDIDVRSDSLKQIKKLWSIGTTDDSETSELLQYSGYSASLSNLMVKSWGNESDYVVRERLIASVIKKAVADNLDLSAVESLTRTLGLGVGETNQIADMIEIARATKSASPTRAELRQFMQAGIISVTDWETQMSSRGYSAYWIDKYKQLYKV